MMKVAIMGAGLAGLSCAKLLEDNHIQPTILERRHRVGERFPNMEAIMQVIHRPIDDPLLFINKMYGLSLIPAGIVHTLEIYSPNNKATIKGNNLGYSTIRGHDDRSLERQLEKQVKSKIEFNSTVTWQELQKDFDWVVIATGDPTISRELGVWVTDVEPFLKGCTIKGQFNTGVTKLWLNQELAKQGYVYFAPFDTEEACVCVAAAPTSHEEIDILWERTKKYLNIDPVPKTEFKVDEYKIGRAKTKQIQNLLLVGNAGGSIFPLMGFGQIPSILSGVYAAQAIVQGKDYNALSKQIDRMYLSRLVLRKYIDKLDNKGFDQIVSKLNLHPSKYLFANTNYPILERLSKLVQLRNVIKSRIPKQL